MVNVLILSKDPSLFAEASGPSIGDARRRHIFYANRLLERYPGSEIRVLTYTLGRKNGGYDQPTVGLRLYGTRSPHRAMYLFGVLGRLPAVLADGWKPDLVTVQTPWEEGVVGCLLARWLNAKFLPQIHFDMFSVGWVDQHWLNPWRRRVAMSLLRCAGRARVVSTNLRDNVVSHCGLPKERVYVAPVGVNFVAEKGCKSHFKSRVSVGLEKRKIVLFVGRLCAEKNLALWVEVARLVREQVPTASFLIVGDGPDEHMLHDLVSEVGLADFFVFAGRKPHEELPPIYAAADVFLLTSHYEGFGRVILEALLSGVPVVSTACSGPEDLITDGQNGYLLPCGDTTGLAARVIELLESDTHAVSMGQAGRKILEDQYSLTALTDRMIDSWVAT